MGVGAGLYKYDVVVKMIISGTVIGQVVILNGLSLTWQA